MENKETVADPAKVRSKFFQRLFYERGRLSTIQLCGGSEDTVKDGEAARSTIPNLIAECFVSNAFKDKHHLQPEVQKKFDALQDILDRHYENEPDSTGNRLDVMNIVLLAANNKDIVDQINTYWNVKPKTADSKDAVKLLARFGILVDHINACLLEKLPIAANPLEDGSRMVCYAFPPGDISPPSVAPSSPEATVKQRDPLSRKRRHESLEEPKTPDQPIPPPATPSAPRKRVRRSRQTEEPAMIYETDESDVSEVKPPPILLTIEGDAVYFEYSGDCERVDLPGIYKKVRLVRTDGDGRKHVKDFGNL